jgi:NAD(P)-dependent dehydrogenase (short-subunit alcohol dehydrogenase family)
MMLEGKLIIVTGSTTGIGEAIARRCVSQGANVLIHGRDESRAKALSVELGKQATYVIADMADALAPQVIVQKALDFQGRIDGLVNNAAWIKRSNLQDTDVDTFDKVMATNARGPLLMIQAAMPYLLKTQGSVVGMGSVNAYCGEANQLAYAMSKAAHMTMSRNLADTYAPKQVRFNHMNVGWVLTDNEYVLKQTEGMGPDWPEEIAGTSAVPTSQMTQPEQIAQHVVFWLSDLSRPVSGAVVDLEQYPFLGRNPTK